MTQQITIPLATLEQLVGALEVLSNLDADINFLNTNKLEEMVEEALTAGRAVLDGAERAQERERIANEPTGPLGVRTGPIANQASACG